MKKIFAVLLLSASLAACVGKTPYYSNGGVYAPRVHYAPANVVVAEPVVQAPYAVVTVEQVPSWYVRQPVCRFHGNAWADGAYTCADAKNF
jgi:hypothetical protein